MSDVKPTFQQLNGCAACKHTASADPGGRSAESHGKGFWCTKLGKPVDARDGAACPAWEYGG